jgi:hypothetical protein
MKFSFFTVFSVLFFTSISYSNSDQTSEIELKKIELEEKKFDTVMEQRSSRVNSNKDQLTVKSTETSDEFDFLNGEWYGSIGNKQIRIMIESVVGNQLKGYNIVSNNKRPIQGTVKKLNVKRKATCQSDYCAYYKVILSEPGDHKWDGVFTLEFEATSIDGAEENGTIYWFHVGDGQWKSYDGKLVNQVMNLKNI